MNVLKIILREESILAELQLQKRENHIHGTCLNYR